MWEILTILACIFGPLWLIHCIYIGYAFWIRRDSDYIKYRSPALTLFAEVMVCILGLMYIIRWSTYYQVPCFISVWVTQFSYPVVYCAILARSIRLLFLYRLSEARLFAAVNIQENRKGQTFGTSKSERMNSVKHSDGESVMEMCTLTYPSDSSFVNVCHRNLPLEDSWFLRHLKVISSTYMKGSIGVVLAAHVVVLIVIQSLSTRISIYPTIATTNCFNGWEWVPHQIFITLYNVCMLFLIVVLRNVVDAYGIRTELTVMCVVNAIIDVFFIIYYNQVGVKEIDPNNHLVNIAFIYLLTFQYQMVIRPIMVVRGYRSIFLPMSRSSDNQNLTLCMESLDLLLSSPPLMEQFKMFSVKDFTVENVLFYERCMRFRNDIGEGTGSNIAAEVSDIFDTFIAYESRLMINLTGRTRQTIQEMINGNVYHLTMFDIAVEEVKDLMFRNTYPRFLQSKRHMYFGWDSVAQV
ncbi:hypothetical protein K7432_015336 [Basidiobolus ranarum]|uniref:RGS domain-containing protein n=1 Tax=Basidiobolus ranarum TaxID=34480 RepID=A0ABR2VP64_9FUNG